MLLDDSFISLPLPDELDNSFFFSSTQLNLEKPIEPFRLADNFIYEAFYYNGFDIYKPWKNSLVAIPQLFIEWDNVKADLEILHSRRDSEATLAGMKKGICLFFQLLFWSNQLPVSLKEPFLLTQLKFKPINLSERIGFILSNPNLFHSFRQLSELMVEQEKLFAKKNICKKASKPIG